MEDKLVTLAILTYAKAQILKNVLANEGIEAYIHNINLIQPIISTGVRVRIKESDLPKALSIIESSAWLAEEVVKEKESSDASNTKNKKILIPIDFSDYSLKACRIGFSFAKATNSEVIILHVYFSPIYYPSLPYSSDSFNLQVQNEETYRNMLDNIHHELNNLSDTIKKKIESKEFPDVKYKCVLRDGIPEDEILHYAKEKKPHIIIMGTRGQSKKDLDLIGSVTAEVIERAKCFVYAIPEHSQLKTFDDIKKIGFVTSFDQRDLIAFDVFMKEFSSYNFQVSLITLTNDKNNWDEIKLAGVKVYFENQYPNLKINYNVIMEDHLLSNLDKYVHDENIDVIAITNYKRNIFARLFNPSIARKMIFHANTPILVIK